MVKIIIESIEMIKCLLNKEYVLLSNCCNCKYHESTNDNYNYIGCKYKV